MAEVPARGRSGGLANCCSCALKACIRLVAWWLGVLYYMCILLLIGYIAIEIFFSSNPAHVVNELDLRDPFIQLVLAAGLFYFVLLLLFLMAWCLDSATEKTDNPPPSDEAVLLAETPHRPSEAPVGVQGPR